MKERRRKWKEHGKMSMNEDKENYVRRITSVVLITQECAKLEK
jgi:hypothetical protein